MWSFWVVISFTAVYDPSSRRDRFGEEGFKAGDGLLGDEGRDVFTWS